MKKHVAVILILIFTVVTVWGMVPIASGQEKAKQEVTSKGASGFTIARVVVGTGVDNLEPVGIAEAFPSTTEKVYCFLEATGITEDTEISFVWFHGDKEMLKFDLPLKIGPRWRTYAFKNLKGLKGDWKVEIRGADGKVLKDIIFKVE
ncbi:MAG: DUF2914 domain-containing protein [Thermodesulfobacteriota bacterium]